MSKIAGKCVCITGGASGVGKILGQIALEKGARQLVIWDINPDNIEKTIAELSVKGNVAGYIINVADFEAVKNTYKQVRKEFGDVDILINCAGVVRGNNTFDNQRVEDIDLTMDINAKAPMYTTLVMLPDMKARNSGHICNIAVCIDTCFPVGIQAFFHTLRIGAVKADGCACLCQTHTDCKSNGVRTAGHQCHFAA